MKEEFLNRLRIEAKKELEELEEYNERARLSQQRAKENSIRNFGLIGCGLDDGSFLEKTEKQIIMEKYKKHIGEIKEEDTNKIYYYVGTFKDVLDKDEYDDMTNYIPIEVSSDDPDAEYRVYANVEGLYSYRINLDDVGEFERTHTIIYDEKANNYQSSAWWRMCNVIEDFVMVSFKENQENACSLVLRKYNANKK